MKSNYDLGTSRVSRVTPRYASRERDLLSQGHRYGEDDPQKKLSAREVMEAHLLRDRTCQSQGERHRHSGPSRSIDGAGAGRRRGNHARQAARAVAWASGGSEGQSSNEGDRTTWGSILYRDHVPNFDCLLVEREKYAGAIVIGKTNLPELGLGSQTFNKVFGLRSILTM